MDSSGFLLKGHIKVNSSIKTFPIVCVGGSTGGLDAYTRLLENLPADMDVAIVIVNHITIMPTQLHTVLPRFTTMPVELITENLHLEGGEFHLRPISKPRLAGCHHGFPAFANPLLDDAAGMPDGIGAGSTTLTPPCSIPWLLYQQPD